MIRLGEMFEDHMVLQRERPVPVWGECDREGKTVSVRLCGAETSAQVRGGRFRADLPAMDAGGPYIMRVQCGEEQLTFSDVMVGEVWLAGGQSNMEMPLFAAQGAKAYLETCGVDNIRLKTISRRSAGKDRKEYGFHFIPESSDEMPWRRADAGTAALFSAIGFAAGRILGDVLKIPIGIISCNYGATRVQPWVSPETMRDHPVFRGDTERFAARRQALGQKAQAAWDLFQRDVENAMKDRADFVRKSLENPLYYVNMDAELHWIPDYAVGDQNEPSCLYRYMLSRVFPYALRGVWWYQGESSAILEDCGRYREEMEALIDDWRAAFENAHMPFIQAQLAPYDTSRRADPCDWAVIRQAQCDVCRTRENVFVTNLTGIGEPRNIHPRFKLEAAARMADTTLVKVYGVSAPLAPEAAAVFREGEWLRVDFDNAAGLHIEDGDMQLETGDGAHFYPAEEYFIREQSLMVRTQYSFVRYGWHCMPGECLKNADSLGATPFCMEEHRA